jgi:cytochrome P460
MAAMCFANVRALTQGQEVAMRRCGFCLVAIAMTVCVVAVISSASAQSAGSVFVTTIPAGYRDWKLISVAHEEANLNSFGAVLGNDVAIQAYRDGTLPFPDGTIIAALHYRFVPSEENNKAFGQAQSFVAGDPTNIQFMVKDSKKYASTGGWGYGHFGQDGTPGGDALLKTCSPCHAKAVRDAVFTRYSR